MKDYLKSASWPYFAEDEIAVVSDVLASGNVNTWTGDETDSFESEFSNFVGSKFSLAVSNGTVSLDMSLRVLDIGEGDEVIVTARSYFASAGSIALVGARPVFADVCPKTQGLTVETIEHLISAKTKAIIPVHLAGWPCHMESIMSLANEHGLHVIEDCAQAHGAMIGSRHVGTYGALGSFSFCQDKIMTTGGEGGMIVLNDEELNDKLWSLRDHGKSQQQVRRKDHPLGFRWLHDSFGSNYRLTEMQSAIGRVQLRKLDDWRLARTRNAETFNIEFSQVPGIRLTIPPSDITHAYYKYYCFVNPSALKTGWNRDRIMREIVERGVPCYSGACPEMYLEKAIEKAGYAPEKRLPVSRELGETALMLLVHPTLTPDHVGRAAETVKEVMSLATANSGAN